ncbi:porin [Octadecabacter sp.]|nr:porin [Octadecabacter sp.]MDC1430218.1 porin [Octadecabacter sp.]
MKNILLASTALVTFAGAAAAEGHTSISFGGAASAEYNSETGYTTDAELTASMSAALDNGLTAAASISFESDSDDGDNVVDPTHGSISLSSDTASLTFGTGLVGAVRTISGDDYAIGTGDDDAIEDGEIDGIVGTIAMGNADVIISAPLTEGAAGAGVVEVGVSTSAGGWNLGVAVTEDGGYTMAADGTAGGADVNVGASSDSEWDLGVSLPAGPLTVSASTDEESAWTVGAAYAADGVSAGIEVNSDDTWDLTVGYTSAGVAVAAGVDQDSTVTLGATYDMGNGLTIGAGIENVESDAYAFAAMDLGGGASAFVNYGNVTLEEVGPSERDIDEGTTVGVSFAF